MERTSRCNQAWSGAAPGAEMTLCGHPGPPMPCEQSNLPSEGSLAPRVGGTGADSHISCLHPVRIAQLPCTPLPLGVGRGRACEHECL